LGVLEDEQILFRAVATSEEDGELLALSGAVAEMTGWTTCAKLVLLFNWV
jgi:hypothetical protein